MAAVAKFVRVADELLEFEKDFNESSDQNSVFSLEVQREELKAQWQAVKTAYEECLHAVATSVDPPEIGEEVIKSKYKHCYGAYVTCAALMGEYTHNLTARPCSSPIVAGQRTTEAPVSINYNLPPCDTQLFYGDYMSWPSFRDLFTAIYINNARLSPVEKLFHLNQKTKGEANEIVRKSPLTHEGFTVAWKNLVDRYENKRILVNSQLKILFNMPTVPAESGTGLKKLQRDINNCISALQLHGVDVSSWDAIFTYLCSTRLPENTLALWEQTVERKTEIPRWEDLNQFLTNRFQTLETVSDLCSGHSSSVNVSRTQPPMEINLSRRVRAHHTNTADPSCRLCSSQGHVLRTCPKFLDMDAKQRLATVRKYHMCINCLASSHDMKDCRSPFSCGTCKKRHHSLLHREEPFRPNSITPGASTQHSPSSELDSPRPSTSRAATSQVNSCFATTSKRVLLGTARVTICHLGTTFTVRALLDSGSEGTFVSERLQKRLRLPTLPTQAQVSGLNNAVSATTRKICKIILGSPRDSEWRLEARALVLPQLTGNLPSDYVEESLLSGLPEIPLADSNFYQSEQVDVLIGGDLYPSVVLEGVRRQVLGTLLAQETVFGWVVTGPLPAEINEEPTTCAVYYSDIALDQQVARFWELEDLPKNKFLTPEEQFCEENFVKTTRRTDEGRYVVRLPFKSEGPVEQKLGGSRHIAMGQFLRNERSLGRKPELRTQYSAVVREYFSMKHSHRVPTSHIARGPHYYLPHHAVLKPESASTKVRVVFNASSATSTGVSLNDVLHTGPVLQADLTLLILKWRFYRYVFSGDIEKMYRQILVDPEHTPFQRILYRDSPDTDVEDFELDTVTFGVNCAPYLAIRTLLKLAEDVQEKYPLAARVLRECMYVDDAMIGTHDLESALSTRDELISALLSAGFPLRKWTANCREILQDLPPQHLLNTDFLVLEESSVSKALGIRWNASTDHFYFAATAAVVKQSCTKREVLSSIARLFDPAGWLSPIIVVAKILMQDIWLERSGWDEEVSHQIFGRWKAFLDSYHHINLIKVPRWVQFTPDRQVELHAFCDASEKAYAAAVYLRVEIPGRDASSSLLFSKTKVAPIKTISLPRLELCGAVLLAEMVESLLLELGQMPSKVYYWTDSTIVLSWLRKPPCTWTTFVANRVAKIIEKVGQSNWFHVDSEDNPADLGSRGVLAQDLVVNPLWWNGPSWLRGDKASWPQAVTIADCETSLEAKPVRTHFSYFSNHEDVLDRFSDFARALRVLAYVFRFYHRTHKNAREGWIFNTKTLSAKEINFVRNRLVLVCQKVHLAAEYHDVTENQPLSRKSTLLTLNPFLDPQGILRVGGRLAFSPSLTYDERHPIILPYNSHLSRLLIRFTHLICLHGGNQLVLRLVRTQFWIPKVKNLIKTVIHACKVCVIYRKKQHTQIMAALPASRTTLSRPFATTGVDFAGPFDIKSFKSRGCVITKGYACVFVCFATKAIHLEAVSDLTTPAFMAAFTRFIGRRGCPESVYSDNGKNFVGASAALKAEFKAFIRSASTAVQDKHMYHSLTWHFIPAGAPHMGGLWEAGVKSFKTHLKKFGLAMKYTFEEFATLLARIESCLNSRPLGPMSENPDCNAVLTPGHFLVGGPLLAPVESEILDTPISIINRWQKVKAVHQIFCKRWKTEYLSELHKRYRWQHPQRDITTDDLVVIRDENLPPNEWRLGRITQVHPGKDGKVRVAEVRTARGLITRPIAKLVVLPQA